MPLLEQKTKKLWGPGQSPGVTKLPVAFIGESLKLGSSGKQYLQKQWEINVDDSEERTYGETSGSATEGVPDSQVPE